jgi:hypothetical protein
MKNSLRYDGKTMRYLVSKNVSTYRTVDTHEVEISGVVAAVDIIWY